MRKNVKIIALAFLVQVVLPGATCQARAKTPYPATAPLTQYLIQDEASEIAPARSAAPTSNSDGAEVMVLGPEGYTTAVTSLYGMSQCNRQNGIWAASKGFNLL